MKTLQRWSTDRVDARHRLNYWVDSICESYLEMDSTPSDRADFFGLIEVCPMDRLAATRAVGSAQTVVRDAGAISRSASNSYYLISQPRLAWRIAHADQNHLMLPGQSVLVDSRLAYRFDFPDGLDDLSVQLPIDWVERWLPDPRQVIGRPIGSSGGWGLALRGLKEAFVPEEIEALRMPCQLIEDQVGLLLALSCGQLGEPATHSRPTVQRCEAYMRQRLCDPDVCAAEVAREGATSLRSLHRAFAAEGQTFAGRLMAMRLLEGKRMLSDRRFRNLTIGEIARRCGFLDASHFARQFRRRHGVAPAVFRAVDATGLPASTAATLECRAP